MNPQFLKVLPLICLAGPAFGQASVEIPATHPKHGPITRFVTVPGFIKPLQQATLYARVPGYVKVIPVDKGDAVKAGALLAELDAPDLVAELAKCEAEVASAQAKADFAQRELVRTTKAAQTSPDLIQKQQLDKSQSDLVIAQAAADLASANADKARTMVSFLKIEAPFAGIVTARKVDPGAFVPAATAGGAAGNAAVLTLMDFSSVRVQAGLPESEASLVAKGQPVKLTIEGLPGRTFEGTVTRFAYAIDEATRTMSVESELPNNDLALRPGQYASVKVGVQKHDNALLIPVEGLVMEKQNAFVFTAVGGRAKKNAVQAGFNDGVNVEVASGLADDAIVLLAGKMTLLPDQPVTAKEASGK